MKADQTTDTILRGHWLAAAWVSWVAIVALAAVVFVAITLSASDEPGVAQDADLSDAQDVAFLVVMLLVFVGSAALIMRHRLNNRMAMLVALALVTFPLNLTAAGEVEFLTTHPGWRVPLGLRDALSGFSVIMLLLFLFPDGRFVPRWTRLLFVTWIVLGLSSPFVEKEFPEDADYMFVVFVGFLASGVVAQIYRYRRVSGALERQQTKWVITGLTATVSGALVWYLIYQIIIPSYESKPAYLDVIAPLVIGVLLLLFPITVVIAILRYRLYDIDVVVNRALVYGLLTATLVGAYFGIVIGLQAAFRAATGQDSNVAIVISTLLIAALFLPLRRRLQEFIDRRFYRRRYDAARTLATFAATARDEVDLERLSGALVAVVRETMEPAHVSLWLREDGARRQRSGG